MKVCAFLTDGFETVEALAVIDILRRADIRTDMISITGDINVKSAQGVVVKADALLDDTYLKAMNFFSFRVDLDISHIMNVMNCLHFLKNMIRRITELQQSALHLLSLVILAFLKVRRRWLSLDLKTS